MPVSNEIFYPLLELYDSYSESTAQDEFLKKNRKQIKILVDSIWEQAVESLFSIKPRNYTDARSIINKHKNTLKSTDDLLVIDSLMEVLREYEVLIDKSYIDLAKRIRPFFLVSLKRLCIHLSLHKAHKFNEHAIDLRNLLDTV